MSPPPAVLQTLDQNGNLILVHPNGQISHDNATTGSSSSSAPTSNLPMMAIHNLNMEPASEATKTEAPVAFVKMEQLDASSSSLSNVPAEPPFIGSIADLDHSPPPSTHSRSGPKKRRSWGQELPEPTTNLPPRKRAKTDAEKEQRRIERVKRNRQAAHNSRERKRQEHEALEEEVMHLKQELERARRKIAELTGNKNICSPVIGETQVPEAGSVQHLFIKSPFQSPTTQAESLFTAAQLPLMGTLTRVSSSFCSETSTTTTPVLSNSSDFTSPATEPLPFTPTIDPLNLGQTRQLAVSPLGTAVDEVINFGNGTVGDFDLFGPSPSSGSITELWAPTQPTNIGSSLHQQSPLLHGADSDACFTDPNDGLLGEFLELSEQSYSCARPAFRGASAAGPDHAVEQA